VESLGGAIGTYSYAIAGALHAGQTDKIPALSASLQAEVQALKWTTRGDRELLHDPDMVIPDFIANTKTDRDLFDRYAEPVEGDSALVKQYNMVVDAWERELPGTSPLLHFKLCVPIWAQPRALDFVEEAAAVVQVYNRWIASVLKQNDNPGMDELEGPLSFLRAWEQSKHEDRKAWATAAWHVCHGSRADTTASAAMHVFTEEMVSLIAEQTDGSCDLVMPTKSGDSEAVMDRVDVIPLVGGHHVAEETGYDLRSKLGSMDDVVIVETRPNGGANAAFWVDDLYLGQVPKDHELYTAIPIGQVLKGRLQMRGKTAYLITSSSPQN
jgi:hypothetical protein